jgi:uncharacterized protein YegP (UPF0339 family)
MRSVSLVLFSLSERHPDQKGREPFAMATTKNKARASHEVARGTGASSKPASMEFLIFEDNGGDYHWRIIAGNGGTLAQSVSFSSYEDAEQAARRVRIGVGSATFAPRASEVEPVDFAARRAPAK